MKVIIVDDEMKICQLIKHLIDWDAMGLEVVDIVNDGKAAYESICKNKPNIVITDIRMPNYDGLELIRLCREQFPDVYFIIVSGYGEFDYAKNAIQYGVEDYLLKPIKKKELENALTKIKEKYDTDCMERQENESLRLMANSAKDKIRQGFLTNVIKAANDPGVSALLEGEEVNRQYQCRFQPGLFTVVIFRLFGKKEAEFKSTFEFLYSKLQEVAKENLEPYCAEFLTVLSDGVVCLLNTANDQFPKVKKQFHKIKSDVTNEIFSGTALMIGVGDPHTELSDVVAGFREAEEALQNRMGFSGEYIIEYSRLTSSGKSVSDFIGPRMRDDIIAAQERMDVNAILACIQRLREQLSEYRTDAKLVYGCFLDLIETLQFGSKNYGVLFKKFDLEESKRKYRSILTFEELFDWVSGEVVERYREFTNQKKVAEKKPIRVAKQYIYDNYNKNLTLESVSGHTGFNPTYFSVFFKKETGMNFLDYVTELRIKNAKFYIVSTDMDIADIAAEVGYSDLKYFSKLFKKSTGINPTEYRKLYG